MAGKQGYPEANIIDPRWILSEDTGKLSYETIHRVYSHPVQALIVSHTQGGMNMSDRYLRIMADKRRRRDV